MYDGPEIDQTQHFVTRMNALVPAITVQCALQEAVRLGWAFFTINPVREEIRAAWEMWHVTGVVSTEMQAVRDMMDGDWAAENNGVQSMLTTLRFGVARAQIEMWGRSTANPFVLARIPAEHLRASKWHFWSSRIDLGGGHFWTDVQFRTNHTLQRDDLKEQRQRDMADWVELYPSWVSPAAHGKLLRTASWAEMHKTVSRREIWKGVSVETFENIVKAEKGYKGKILGWRDLDPRVEFPRN